MPTKRRDRYPTKRHSKSPACRLRDPFEEHQRGDRTASKRRAFEYFHALTPEALAAKLKRVNSPLIYSEGWSGSNPGGTFEYIVYIYNPDPVAANNIYAHVFVGSGNVVPEVGLFLLNVDQRFGRLTAEAPSIAPQAVATLRFAIKVPAMIDKTRYIGNTSPLRLVPLDRGVELDRSAWVFQIA